MTRSEKSYEILIIFSTFLEDFATFRYYFLFIATIRAFTLSQVENRVSELGKRHQISRNLVFSRSEPDPCAAGRENGTIWIAPIDQKWWVVPWHKIWLSSAASGCPPQIVSFRGHPLNQICCIFMRRGTILQIVQCNGASSIIGVLATQVHLITVLR